MDTVGPASVVDLTSVVEDVGPGTVVVVVVGRTVEAVVDIVGP